MSRITSRYLYDPTFQEMLYTMQEEYHLHGTYRKAKLSHSSDTRPFDSWFTLPYATTHHANEINTDFGRVDLEEDDTIPDGGILLEWYYQGPV